MGIDGAFGEEASGAVSGAVAGASFGPIGAAAGGIIGLGLSAFGAWEKYSGAKKQTDIQKQEIATQLQEDALRQQQMHIQGWRDQMQAQRNYSQASSLGLARSVNQGAQFSSGATGGQAQIRSEGGTNITSINQNLMAGDQMFALKRQLAEQQIAMADAGGTMNTGSGLEALGSGLINNMGRIRSLSAGSGFNS